jgi:hypothetical protein
MNKKEFELSGEAAYERLGTWLKNMFVHHYRHDFNDGFVFFIQPHILTIEDGLSVTIVVQKINGDSSHVLGTLISPEVLQKHLEKIKASLNQRADKCMVKISGLAAQYGFDFKQIP